MKARLLVAAVGIPFLLAVFLLLPAIATAILFAVLCGIAVYELLWPTGYVRTVRILAVTMLAAAVICFLSWKALPALPLQITAVVFVCYLFAELLIADTKLDFTAVCAAFFAGIVLPFLLSSVVRILVAENGRCWIILPFVMTMVPDSGAFLVGRKLGKHRLAPKISPKKSVEGAVGSVVTGILAVLLYGWILSLLGFTVNYFFAALYGLVGAVGSIAGDLVFSTVKRQHGIKDFGNLLPGHGGVLDRFDSLSVVAPLTELLLLLIPMAVK